jgi:hypothetical protein
MRSIHDAEKEIKQLKAENWTLKVKLARVVASRLIKRKHRGVDESLKLVSARIGNTHFSFSFNDSLPESHLDSGRDDAASRGDTDSIGLAASKVDRGLDASDCSRATDETLPAGRI